MSVVTISTVGTTPPQASSTVKPEDKQRVSPVKVLVDITKGIVHGVSATHEVEVLFYDTEDGIDNPRATMMLPPFVGEQKRETVWASMEIADPIPVLGTCGIEHARAVLQPLLED